jgi:zinc D-Ala-D-Ala carboxypeptidase
MNLSEHFTLEELCFSETAVQLGLANMPGKAETLNLRSTAALMEKIRRLLNDTPIQVHSCYRGIEVNQAVGGVTTSAHCQGLACDFSCPKFGTPYAVAQRIVGSVVEFDQLILEYGWVHVSLAPTGATERRESLTKPSKELRYEKGICC